MKTLYHGTILEYAEKIQREGLKAMPEQAVEAKMVFMPYSFKQLREQDCTGEDGYIDYGDGKCDTTKPHVVKDRSVAARFAEWRKNYTETNPGNDIPDSTWMAFKTAGEQGRPAQAAVVTIQVPNNWPLILDYQMMSDPTGYVSARDIPAKYITAIEAL